MGPSELSVLWYTYGPVFWLTSASEILDEQSLEEHIQKSARALSTLNVENTGVNWGCLAWQHGASEIINEQALEDTYRNASNEVLS
jgi:hypothetical protein